MNVLDRLMNRARAIAWAACALAVALVLAYPILLYLDRNTVAHLHGLPGFSEVVSLATVVAGGLIMARQPRNAIGWMLVFIGLAGLTTSDTQLYSLLSNTVQPKTLPGSALSAWLGSWLFLPGIALLVTLVLLLFPDGRLPSPRWRLVAWLGAAGVVFATAGLAIGAIPRSVAFRVDSSGVLDTTSRLTDTQALALFPFLLGVLCAAGLVVRFRRSHGEERQQMKWFVYGGLVFAAGLFVSVATVIGPGNKNQPEWAGTFQQLTSAAIPIAIAIAVLKYRLYDIDVVISRTLVYSALALFITAVYVAIVVGLGTVVGSGSRPNLVLSIVATAVVAVAFQPVRERSQRIANRVVYGKRATPYEVLSEFSARVAESYAGEQVLPRMAQVLAEGTAAERAEVWLRSGDSLRAAASWPAGANGHQGSVELTGQLLPEIPAADRAVPVRHQGELLGALTVKKRTGESLTPIEDKLLNDLAHQAGLVLKNVGLTSDLQARLEELRASRQRLVRAQDDERRKLERNLHDGAQQHLVALKVKLGLAEALAVKDPDRARQTIQQLKLDADEALDTLRDLARGIYPPLLADKGLVAALEAQARKATLPVEVRANGVERYSQEVEAAVYFCCLEALQNVQKYASATSARVEVDGDRGELRFAVIDDGAGFDQASVVMGAGLQNMKDRLEALDGSFEVVSAPNRGTVLRGSLAVGDRVAALAGA